MSEEQGEYIAAETLECLTTGFDFERVLERLGPNTTVRYERTIGDDYTSEVWTFEPTVSLPLADDSRLIKELRIAGLD